MDSKTQQTLSQFASKAVQRLHDRKIPKKRTIYVTSLDEEIIIRNLTFEEIRECTEIDDSSDPNRSDKYSIYLAVVEPSLKEIATELKAQGEISEYLDVINIFDMGEITEIAQEIMDLSGIKSTKQIKVVEELKNS